MQVDELQALVVGSGVSGLAVARALRLVGLAPVVVDSAVVRPGHSGHVTLWPETRQILERLGVAGDLRDAATPVRRWSLRRPDGTVCASRRTTGAPESLAVPYRRLCERLEAALPPETLRREAALETLEPGSTDASVTAVFENGVRESFDLLVGADGARSRVRRRLGCSDPVFCGTASRPVPLRDGAASTELTEVWASDGSVFRAFPGGDQRTGWLTVPAERPSTSGPSPSAGAEALAAFDRRLPDGFEAAPDDTWRDDFRQRRDRWSEGRVALVGDAAHARHRLGDVGVLLALEDALALTAELDPTERSIPERLAAYASRRRARLQRLERRAEQAPPLDGIEWPFQGASTPLALWSGRLRACFGDDAPTPAVDDPF